MRAHLDDAAERVAVGARRIDRGRVGALLRQRDAGDLDADLCEQRLRDGAGRDVDGGMPRRRALERVAHVGEPVLLDAGEVGVTGARQRHRLRALPLGLALRRPRAHPPRPVLVVAVADDERERRAERAALAQAGQHLDRVRLDLLPRRAAVALLAPPEVGVDRRAVEDEARREAGEDRDERGPVRLARGRELERHVGNPKAARMTLDGRSRARPELEARGALADERLAPVDDRRNRRRARPRRARSRAPAA